jgi:chromosome partitioning protein
MGQVHGDETKFQSIFDNPTINRMLGEIGDTEFEHFIGYVFRQAGFSVEHTGNHRGPGLDLKVLVNGVVKAGVQVKHKLESRLIPVGDVVHLQGGVAKTPGAVGYFVTTSSFQYLAFKEAADGPRIWLIDGAHLIRYIDYIRGSRPIRALNEEEGNSLSAYTLAPIAPDAFFTADEATWRSPSQTRVLTLANHKGGVAKTTTAVNLAFGLAGQGQQVLLVDMDGQANLTSLLPNPQAEKAETSDLSDYFAGRRKMSALVQQTEFPNVWLMPSSTKLTLSDTGVAAGPDAELQFAMDIHSPAIAPPSNVDARPFDWIIIDTGPSMGFFTRASLAASHYAIMPAAPGVFASKGSDLLKRTIGTMEALVGRPISLLGSVITLWTNDAMSRQFVNEVKATLPVLGDEVPFDRSHIERAHFDTGAGKQKMLFDRRGPAATAYLSVIREVRKHVDK